MSANVNDQVEGGTSDATECMSTNLEVGAGRNPLVILLFLAKYEVGPLTETGVGTL